MRTKEEIQDAVSQILKEIRIQSGLSKSKMAAKLGIDERTYYRYESGESTPTLAGFIEALDKVDAPAIPIIKRFLYPELYSDGAAAEIRTRLSDYVNKYASDREVEQLYYIIEGPHGSPLESQMQLFCAFDHVSIEVRLIAAKFIYNMWELESARGAIINTEYPMPDMELLHNALIKATQAVIEGRKAYNTGIKDEVQKV